MRVHMLEKHVKTQKKAICNFCGKVMKNHNSLTRHLGLHSEELKYRYKCSFCGKGYSKKDKMLVRA